MVHRRFELLLIFPREAGSAGSVVVAGGAHDRRLDFRRRRTAEAEGLDGERRLSYTHMCASYLSPCRFSSSQRAAIFANRVDSSSLNAAQSKYNTKTYCRLFPA